MSTSVLWSREVDPALRVEQTGDPAEWEVVGEEDAHSGAHEGAREEDERDGARRDELFLQTGAARGELGPRQRM